MRNCFRSGGTAAGSEVAEESCGANSQGIHLADAGNESQRDRRRSRSHAYRSAQETARESADFFREIGRVAFRTREEDDRIRRHILGDQILSVPARRDLAKRKLQLQFP